MTPASSHQPSDSSLKDKSPATICDWCRSRKIRCKPLEPEKVDAARRLSLYPTCQRCFRNNETCTFTYVLKKSGRPRGSKTGAKSPRARHDSMASASTTQQAAQPSLFDWDPVAPFSSFEGGAQGAPPLPSGAPSAGFVNPTTGPDLSSFFGSALGALSAGAHRDGGTTLWESLLSRLNTPVGSPRASSLDLLPLAGFQDHVPGVREPTQHAQSAPGGYDRHLAWPAAGGSRSEQPQSLPASTVQESPNSVQRNQRVAHPSTLFPLPLDPPTDRPATTHNSTTRADHAGTAAMTVSSCTADAAAIPEAAPWNDVSFFVLLFIKHQHALVPLVHKATFANDIMFRRDERDEIFRGLLASIVAYTICQVPVSLMTGRYTREQLEHLLQSAKRVSRMVQLANAHVASLDLLVSIILDAISSQAWGDAVLSEQLLSEGRRLIYCMKLRAHKEQSDIPLKESQLLRIAFWEFWAVEKTAAMDGTPISLHSFEGVPPLPLEIDDEFIPAVPSAAASNLSQPDGRRSYMAGFITVTRIFRVLGDCLYRHRIAVNCPDDRHADLDSSMQWLDGAFATLRDILNSLPPLSEATAAHANGDDSLWWLGTQIANIHITALSTEFSLLDYKGVLLPETDITAERHETAKRAYEVLSGMPVVYLASNGESMVLRIILSLLTAAPSSPDLGDHVWGWWNMYSTIQFLQVIPQTAEQQIT